MNLFFSMECDNDKFRAHNLCRESRASVFLDFIYKVGLSGYYLRRELTSTSISLLLLGDNYQSIETVVQIYLSDAQMLCRLNAEPLFKKIFDILTVPQ